MKDMDFGVYGKGFEGYTTYMWAHEEGHRRGGGRGPSSSGGCCLFLFVQLIGTSLLFLFSIVTLVSALF